MFLLLTTRSLSALAAVAVASTTLTSRVPAQGEDRKEAWQAAWPALVKELQAWMAGGTPASEFESRVAGRTAVWEGAFRGLRTSGRRELADVDFGADSVRLSDGRHAPVTAPPIVVSETDLPAWRAMKAGARVKVRLTITLDSFFNVLFLTEARPTEPPSVTFLAQSGELVRQ